MTDSMPLWNDKIPAFDPEAETPNLLHKHLVQVDAPAPAVVILPGGGYFGRAADHEGRQIAAFYNSCGFHAFVVDYRVHPNRHPAPVADAQRAIRLVRANAAAFGVDPDRIFVCGFSAGGHLTASTAILTEDFAAVGDELDAVSCRPTGAILGYPVISGMPEHSHTGSHQNLLGENYEAMRASLSLHTRVDQHTAPCFIWHTAEDGAVPVCHSLLLAGALAQHGIPYELHVFPHGHHGLGLAPEYPDVARWAAWSAEWIRRQK